jgi:hypothetical protein
MYTRLEVIQIMPRSIRAAVGDDPNSKPKRRQRPATTPEARENQLISLAVEVAEEQLFNRTASAQVITHYLKLATTRESLEKEKLRQENELLKAKSNSIMNAGRQEELMKEAVKAFSKYSGSGVEYED